MSLEIFILYQILKLLGNEVTVWNAMLVKEPVVLLDVGEIWGIYHYCLLPLFIDVSTGTCFNFLGLCLSTTI